MNNASLFNLYQYNELPTEILCNRSANSYPIDFAENKTNTNLSSIAETRSLVKATPPAYTR